MIANFFLAFSYLLFSESEGGDGGLLSVNPGLAFWMVLTFLLLLIILKKFAWKPILTALDEREKKIKESLELAEKAKQDAQKLIDENKANLAKAEEESKKIIEQSRTYAENLKAQMLVDSKIQAQKLISDASNEIERKKQEAFSELKTQVALLSIQVAEKLIKQNLDKKSNEELINNYLKELQKN